PTPPATAALPASGPAITASAAAGGARQPVARGEFSVPGQHDLALTAGEDGVEAWLVQRISWNRDRLIAPDFPQRSLIDRGASRPRYRSAGPHEYPLPI